MHIIFFYFSTKICCRYSKEPDDEMVLLSTLNIFKLMGKKIITLLHTKIFANANLILFQPSYHLLIIKVGFTVLNTKNKCLNGSMIK